jgi:hypothetical protein
LQLHDGIVAKFRHLEIFPGANQIRCLGSQLIADTNSVQVATKRVANDSKRTQRRNVMRAELLLEFVHSAILASTALPLISRIAGQRTWPLPAAHTTHVRSCHDGVPRPHCTYGTVHNRPHYSLGTAQRLLSRGQTFGGTDDNWGPVIRTSQSSVYVQPRSFLDRTRTDLSRSICPRKLASHSDDVIWNATLHTS